MAFVKKVWKNRLVEFAGRRKLTRVAGSIDNQIVVDVTREEGMVSQPGDAFSEENMNDLEQRIEDGFNDTIDKDNILDKEGVEANTEAGKYVADALVVKDLSNSLGGLNFYEDEKGDKYVVGADSVPKKLGSCIFGDIPDGNLIIDGLSFPATLRYESGGYFVKDGMCYVDLYYTDIGNPSGGAANITGAPRSTSGYYTLCNVCTTNKTAASLAQIYGQYDAWPVSAYGRNNLYHVFGMYYTTAVDTE